MSEYWLRSNRADPRALPLADRHYNRQKIGSPQFVPPGRCVVFVGRDEKAVWVTSYPYAQYVKHAWAGAWVNSLFRNESDQRASEIIREAVVLSKQEWEPPALGLISFVDAKHVPAVHRRLPPIHLRQHAFEFEGKTTLVGYCYLKAGFRHVGYTKTGLWAWQMRPEAMPS